MSNVFTPAPSELGARGEEIISWWMEKNGHLTDDVTLQAGNRDAAIGSLMQFVNGFGQPSTELFTAFPELAKTYYEALGKLPASKTTE